jgi:hypothetical protein
VFEVQEARLKIAAFSENVIRFAAIGVSGEVVLRSVADNKNPFEGQGDAVAFV